MRTLAVGDIHGSTACLDALLDAVKPRRADRLVFLGDYVDRGPDSRGVIERLIALKKSHDVVCLRGNHELMMMRARLGADHLKMWLSVGGAQCLASYSATPARSGKLADVPDSHWEFLEAGCVDWALGPDHLFVHAGADPQQPLDKQPEAALFWEFLAGPIHWPTGQVVVCGHTSQRTGEVLDYGSTVCIDTYAYGGKYLTCLDVGARSYWQADALGAIRTGELTPRGG